jgi:hypothetical protein
MAPGRLRELEASGDLSYLEGIRIAKTFGLCPTCFKRHFEGAVEVDLARSQGAPDRPVSWPSEAD